MKTRKIAVITVMTLVLMLTLIPSVVSAATVSKDGINVTVSTDKTDYTAGDTVQVDVKVTNTGSSRAADVIIDVVLPDGLSLVNGQLSYSLAALEPDAIWTQSIQTKADESAPSPDDTDSDENDSEETTEIGSPKTGDSSINAWILIAITVSTAIALALLIYKKKKNAIKLMSLMLCVMVSVCIIAPSASVAEGPISVEERFTIDGVEKSVKVNMSYNLAGPYTYNTPATIKLNGWDFSVSYDHTSPQAPGKVVTPTMHFANGSNPEWFEYTLSSVTLGGVIASGSVYVDKAGSAVCSPFTMPAQNVQDINLKVNQQLFTFNTPASITDEGWDFSVSYDLASPQAAGTLITPTITIANGQNHDLCDITLQSQEYGGVMTSISNHQVLEDQVDMPAFTMPAKDLQDIELIVTWKACFTADTPVLTKEGSKKIDEIEIDDMVWSWNEEANEHGYNKVTKLHVHENTRHLWYLEAGDETIKTTSVHRFYVADKGFISADEVSKGDYLLNTEGQKILVSKSFAVTPKEPVTVYNLTVENAHTYYAGGVLVHNGK